MSASEPSHPHSTQNPAIAKAAAASAAIALVAVGIFIYLLYRFLKARRGLKKRFRSSFRREIVPTMSDQELGKQGGTVDGRIADERGLGVLYMTKGGQITTGFPKVWNNPMGEEEKVAQKGVDLDKSFMCEIPLLESTPLQQNTCKLPIASEPSLAESPPGEAALVNQHAGTPKSPMPSPNTKEIPTEKLPCPPPPPPPSPPLPSTKSIPKPPLPNLPPPSPPPRGGMSLPKPSFSVRRTASSSSSEYTLAEDNGMDNGQMQLRLRPLHWEKVTANVGHSMVWDEINDGSFRFEDDLVEALFGYIPSSKESTEGNQKSSVSRSSSSNAQNFILEPRKSQNAAIVLKSLAISRREIVDAIKEGQGLGSDTLERLTKIAPSQEEAASILQFNGDPAKLANAESFIHYILKAVPSAFIRLNVMLFKSNYDPEMLHFKESLQALKLACKELRTCGMFLKLLEAILKVGNRMNAGTPRGNAQGFDLSALRKLSNVKSTDGKTTLLHFVVEQVIRFEGKRYDMNQNNMMSTDENAGNEEDDSEIDKEEREKEYLTLGLPIMRSLTTELSNVKKAATIDTDNFLNTCSSLENRVNDIRKLLTQCGNTETDGFFLVMKGFLEQCNEELKVVKEEQIRVMKLVKSTREYYHDKSRNPLQLFVILRDFLEMVDQVCIDITRKLQRGSMGNSWWSPPPSPTPGTPVRSQNFNSYFMPENPGNLSSDSDDF